MIFRLFTLFENKESNQTLILIKIIFLAKYSIKIYNSIAYSVE